MKDLQPNFNPQTWTIDFEMAVRNGLQAVFGANAPGVLGCFFHFGQAIWRQIQHLGLQNNYNQDMDFRKYCNMFTALAFVNPDHVRESFDMIINDLPADYLELLRDFIDYMERNWIGRNRANPARFPIDMWTVFYR